MTQQELFNKVCDHLLAQNEQAVTASGSCQYLTNTGLKCAAGCLIPDYATVRPIEGYSVMCGDNKDCFETIVGKENMSFLKGLQRIHDYMLPRHWPAALMGFTIAHNLDPTKLLHERFEEVNKG